MVFLPFDLEGQLGKKKMLFSEKTKNEVISYNPARLHTGKNWYVSYYAYDPESDKLKIRRIKLNYIKKASDRRLFALGLMKRINSNLEKGWNPFIESESKKSYKKLSEAINHFIRTNKKKLQSRDIREETFTGYMSYVRNLQKFLIKLDCQDMLIYKFNRSFINAFLEHVYMDLNRSSQTRDNYLAIFRVFSTFLVEKEYLSVKPTDGITNIGKKRIYKKDRSVIQVEHRIILRDYLKENNLFYLLACEVLYYCFIRPKEMSHIKINHVNFTNKTIFIPGETAKNHRDSIVTIPKPLGRLFNELKIQDYPENYYLFSDKFKPGKKRRDEKQFRDYWIKLRKLLKFPNDYKFYSLKDTGITDLLSKLGDPRLVRDQARHHSISMTDIYTPHNIMKANPLIENNETEF